MTVDAREKLLAFYLQLVERQVPPFMDNSKAGVGKAGAFSWLWPQMACLEHIYRNLAASSLG